MTPSNILHFLLCYLKSYLSSLKVQKSSKVSTPDTEQEAAAETEAVQAGEVQTRKWDQHHP